MARDGRDMPLPVAFLLALVLHAGAVILLAPSLVRDAAGFAGLSATLTPDALLPPEPEPPETQLGIDAQTPSSMTWIGYDTFLEHLARLSAVEQAQFEDDPGAMSGSDAPVSDGAPATVETSDAPVDVVEPVAEHPESEGGTPVEPIAESPAEPAPAPEVEPELTVRHGLDESDDAAPSIVGPAAPPTDADGTTAVPPLTADQVDTIANALLPGLPEITPRPRSPREEPPAPVAVTEPTAQPEREPVETDSSTARPPTPPDSEPAVASDAPSSSPAPRRRDDAAGAARSGDGQESDREAAATAIVEVPLAHLRSGRPVASHGLELLTRNPVFPVLTSVTAAPRNPLVEIHFGHDGRPRHAGLLESSGDPRVDGPVVDSLYRWRARGAGLEELVPDDPRSVIRIRMRILLRNR